MAEKRIDPTEKGGKKFRIVIDDEQKANFPDQREVLLVLTDTSAAQLDVLHKDIPGVLKGVEYNGKKIRWLNNFGLKKKNSADYEAEVASYTVILDKVDGAEYVYYDGPTDRFDKSGLHPLNTEPVPGDDTKVQATLTRGDPATGWVN